MAGGDKTDHWVTRSARREPCDMVVMAPEPSAGGAAERAGETLRQQVTSLPERKTFLTICAIIRTRVTFTNSACREGPLPDAPMKSYRSRRRPQLAFFRFFDHADRLRRAFFRTNPTAFAVLEVNLDRDGALHHRVRTVKPADVTRGSFIPAGCAFVMINHGPEGPPVSRPAPLSRAQAGMSVGEWVQFSCLSHDVLPRSLFSTPKGAALKSCELRVAGCELPVAVACQPWSFSWVFGCPTGS